MIVLKASFDSMKEPGEGNIYSKGHIDDMRNGLMGDAYEVGAKIRSSQAKVACIF